MEFLDEDNNSRDMIDGQREMGEQFHFFACKWTTTKSAMWILFRFFSSNLAISDDAEIVITHKMVATARLRDA